MARNPCIDQPVPCPPGFERRNPGEDCTPIQPPVCPPGFIYDEALERCVSPLGPSVTIPIPEALPQDPPFPVDVFLPRIPGPPTPRPGLPPIPGGRGHRAQDPLDILIYELYSTAIRNVSVVSEHNYMSITDWNTHVAGFSEGSNRRDPAAAQRRGSIIEPGGIKQWIYHPSDFANNRQNQNALAENIIAEEQELTGQRLTRLNIDLFRLAILNCWSNFSDSASYLGAPNPSQSNLALLVPPFSPVQNDFEAMRALMSGREVYLRPPQPDGHPRPRKSISPILPNMFGPDGYGYRLNRFHTDIFAGHHYNETLHFKFVKDPSAPGSVLSREITDSRDLKHVEIMDMYLYGRNSPAFAEKRDLLTPYELRSFSSQSLITQKSNYFDFFYTSAVSFSESETNRLILSPGHTFKVEAKMEFLENRWNTENEKELPNAYHYYQALNMSNETRTRLAAERGLNAREITADSINQELLRLGLDHISGILSGFNEAGPDPFETNKVLKFPSDRVAMLDDINEEMRGQIENFVELSINADQGQTLNSIIQRNKMDCALLELLENNWDQDELRALDPKWARNFLSLSSMSLDDAFIGGNDSPFGGRVESVALTINDKVVRNIPDRIYRNPFRAIEVASQLPSKQIEQYPLYYTHWDNPILLRLEERIRGIICLNEANFHLNRNNLQRSFADILAGRPCYSEIIGYKVEKYALTQDIGPNGEVVSNPEELVQKFYFMDNDDVERINYIDSQVIPNRKYRYKVFTINLVVGNEYQYIDRPTIAPNPNGIEGDVVRFPGSIIGWRSNNIQPELKMDEPNDWWFNPDDPHHLDKLEFSLNVHSMRSLAISYAPFADKIISTYDKPPIPPQAEFLPFQGIDNRFRILVTSNYGERKENPVLIRQQDSAAIQDIYDSQAQVPGQPLIYKSDSMPKHFEILRLDYHPTQFSDFAESESRKAPAQGHIAFFTENIEPNKYYYYTFRTWDQPGAYAAFCSNPSPIYRIRMVSYDSGIFMEIDIVELKDPEVDFEYHFEEKLKICPSDMQKTINFNTALEQARPDLDDAVVNLKTLQHSLGLLRPAETFDFRKTAPSLEQLSLGNTSDTIWGRKFKFRLKSKSTGKMIDLNVNYSYEKKQPND